MLRKAVQTGSHHEIKKLTPAEENRLADAFAATAIAMGLNGNTKLPEEIKQQVRERVLRAIEDERKAQAAREARRQVSEAAENSFTWQPPVTGAIEHNALLRALLKRAQNDLSAKTMKSTTNHRKNPQNRIQRFLRPCMTMHRSDGRKISV